jgi:hypothetical protein
LIEFHRKIMEKRKEKTCDDAERGTRHLELISEMEW